jgi:hypothetical protein
MKIKREVEIEILANDVRYGFTIEELAEMLLSKVFYSGSLDCAETFKKTKLYEYAASSFASDFVAAQTMNAKEGDKNFSNTGE